jgi:hypothetical protein
MTSKQFNVYIHKDLSEDWRIVPTDGLYGVLTLNWLFDSKRCGIPPELVENMYDDHDGLAIQRKGEDDSFSVLYISVDDVSESMHLLQAISVLNWISQMSISIYCSKERYKEVKGFANDNIAFILKGAVSKHDAMLHEQFDLVMTFGPGALHFIRLGLPVILLGPYGYGGLVDPDTFPDLVRCGFLGRPGGMYGETIPAEIIQEELLFLKANRPSTETLEQVKKIAMGLPAKPGSESNSLIKIRKQLKKDLFNKATRGQFKPKIASNIKIIQKNDVSYVKRLYINDTLAELSPKKLPFFEKIDSSRNCIYLQEHSNMSREEFWRCMYMLWDKKIVVFDYAE